MLQISKDLVAHEALANILKAPKDRKQLAKDQFDRRAKQAFESILVRVNRNIAIVKDAG